MMTTRAFSRSTLSRTTWANSPGEMATGSICRIAISPPPGPSTMRIPMPAERASSADFVSSNTKVAACHRGGITVYPRLVASDHTSAYRAEVLPSGVISLDALISGGIDRGTSTLLIGPPGSGKSMIALQYAAAAAARGDAVQLHLRSLRGAVVEQKHRAAATDEELLEGQDLPPIAQRALREQSQLRQGTPVFERGGSWFIGV